MKALAAALLLVLAGGAAAEEAPDIAAELAGEWQIVPVDGMLACAITLGLAPARGGWAAIPGPLCKTYVPDAARATGWTFADGMRLLDAGGVTVMRFEEDDTALPASPSVAAPRFYLIPAIPGFAALRQPGEWEGPWQFSARGQKPCILQFGPPAQIDSQHVGGTVSVRRCRSAALRRMTRWYAQGMGLILAGPDDTQIAFAPDGAAKHRSDDGRWRLAHWTGR